MAIADTSERLNRIGHILNRVRSQLMQARLLEEAESIRVAARECWRAGRLIERKPAAEALVQEYFSKRPIDNDDMDDDALDAEIERLFAA
jgi:hypothetical protein